MKPEAVSVQVDIAPRAVVQNLSPGVDLDIAALRRDIRAVIQLLASA